MDESIKIKIRKLLKLSEDKRGFEEESYVALQKAQELMAKYKLSMKDVVDEEVKKICMKKRTDFSYGTNSSDHYIATLADIIADNFCCVTYISTPRRSRTHYIVFMGTEEDVAICEEVMFLANAAIIRGYDKVYKDMCSLYEIDYIPARFFNPAKIGYIEGYLAGLKKALDSQKESHEEWGLVLVAPQEAIDFKGSLDSRDTGGDTAPDYAYYGDGYKDGSNFKLQKKLEEENQQKLREGI